MSFRILFIKKKNSKLLKKKKIIEKISIFQFFF